MGKKVSIYANGICAFLFFAGITMLMPFYYENKYFNMLQAKSHVVQIMICTLLPVATVIFLLGIIMSRGKDLRWKWNYMDIALVIYALVTVISYWRCNDRATSLWGMDVWGVGTAVMVGLILFYLIASRTLCYREELWILVGIVNGVIFTISIFHSAGVDLLGLHERIIEKQFYTYISTIGNINWFSGYLCLLVPVFVVLFLKSEKIFFAIFYYLISVLAMINIVLCASDSVFVGIGICLFFMVPYLLEQEQRIRRSMLVFVAYGGGLLIVGNVSCFAAKKTVMDGIAKKVLSPSIGLLFLIGGILGYLAIRIWWKKLSVKTIKMMIYVIDGAILAVILGMIIYNISIFGDKWGTKRGIIWKETIRVFGTFDIWKKLFGIGPELLGQCYRGIRERFTYQVLCAHNEYLQYLLTVGLLGMLSWIAMWVGLVIEFFRKKIWKTERIVLFLPLAAYMGQALINSPMALTISMLFVMLTCYRRTA